MSEEINITAEPKPSSKAKAARRKKSGYPKTAAEVIDPSRTYKPSVLRALRTFQLMHPWRGDLVERADKLRKLHHALCKAYDISPSILIDIPAKEAERGNGRYDRSANAIALEGKLSVLTYLHEFAHAAFGPDEFKACAWSVNLFKRIFPKAWSRMKFDGHVALFNKPETAENK